MAKDVVIFTSVDGKLFQRAIGAYQLAHHIRQNGYTVQVADFISSLNLDELKKVIDLYVDESTKVIGISSTFLSDYSSKFSSTTKTFVPILSDNLTLVIEYAKSKFPNLKIVLGGARSMGGESLPFIDCVIHGYAEDKFLDYINSINACPAKTIINEDPENKQFDISELQHAFHKDDFILRNETLPIEISRGCIFKCKFCAYNMNGKKKMDFLRSHINIVDEMKHNYEHYGTTNYYICDDTFNDTTFKVERIANEIAKLPFKIKFACYLRLDLLHAHKEQIPMLYDMGLASPFFGIESLNQKSATSIGKGMNVNKVKEFLTELHDDHWKKEIPSTCSFIIGLPHETAETVNATFEWTKTAPINPVFFPLSLDTQSFYKSEFQKNYASYGYILRGADKKGWRNSHFTDDTATVLAEQFNQELMYGKNIPASWFLMTLLNHNISINEAMDTKVKDLNWTKIVRERHKKIREYKTYLLN